MLRTLITLLTRFGAAGFSFLTVIATTRFLGPAGRGEVSLFVAVAGLLGLLQQFIGGSAVVVLARHYHPGTLVAALYSWNFIFHVMAALVVALGGWLSPPFMAWLFVFSILDNLLKTHNQMLMGHGLLHWDHRIRLSRAVMVLLGFWGYARLQAAAEAELYYAVLTITAAAIMLTSAPAVLQLPRTGTFSWRWPASLYKEGFWAQLAHFIRFLNVRLSYFIIAPLLGKAALGVYSVGVNLGEVLTIFAQGMAITHYINTLRDPAHPLAVRRLIRIAWLSMVLTAGALMVLLALPSTLYSWLFGESFGHSKRILMLLGPGLTGLALATVYHHWFHARRQYQRIVWASVTGLAVNLLLLYPLVNQFGAMGAAAATSAGQLTIAGVALFYFRKDPDRPAVLPGPGRSLCALWRLGRRRLSRPGF